MTTSINSDAKKIWMDKRAKLVTEQMFSCHKTGKEYNYRYNEIII